MEQTEKQKAWAAVEFEVDSTNEDLASWLIVQCGANGCEIRPGTGDRVLVHAVFDKEALAPEELTRIRGSFEEYKLGECLRTFKVQQVEQEDWLARWKEGFEPFRVGTRFLVCPAWMKDTLTPELAEGRVVILIEPGMAFGTGLHATTQFCLRALESYPPKTSVLDVGTGSGILAIACAHMHPNARIVALDIDPVAIETAQEDLELNNVNGRIELIVGSTEAVKGQTFDVILSNLTCEDIVALLPDYMQLLEPDGHILCAGILKEKLPLLESAVAKHKMTMIQVEHTGQWVGVVLR